MCAADALAVVFPEVQVQEWLVREPQTAQRAARFSVLDMSSSSDLIKPIAVKSRCVACGGQMETTGFSRDRPNRSAAEQVAERYDFLDMPNGVPTANNYGVGSLALCPGDAEAIVR